MDDLKNLMSVKKIPKPSKTNQGAVATPATDAPVPRGFFDDGKVRPEYNFAKFSDKIFLPYQSKKLHETRRITWQLSLFSEDNEDPKFYPAEIVITPEQDGQTGTTTTWKVLLGLIRLWEKNGRPNDGVLSFSLRELASILGEKLGGNTVDKYIKELDTLKSVSYKWTWSFYDEDGDPVQLINKMNILSSIAYMGKDQRRMKGKVFDVANSIVFDRHIINNLLSGRTIPVDFDTFISIKSGSSLTLYSHLCTVLSGKSRYERTAINLFNDLELEGTKYSVKRHRKTKLQGLINGLDGKSMASGLLKLAIAETSDGSDWKLVASKISKKKGNSLPWAPVNPPELSAELALEIEAVTGQGSSRDNWIKISKLYDAGLMRRAISEFKADINLKEVENPGKVFNAIVHRLAHLHGKEWIKPCGSDCRHRPR